MDVIFPIVSNGVSILTEDEEFEKIDGTSETRTAIVDEIKRQGIRRPDFNIQRNIAENDKLMMYYHPT